MNTHNLPFRGLLPNLRHRLLLLLKAEPRAAHPPGHAAVGGWIAAECIREPGAQFNEKAAYAAMRRYQADRMLPLPSRKQFARACASLGLPKSEGAFAGVRPRDPACLATAHPYSIVQFLDQHVSRSASGSTELVLVAAAYARAVAPAMPAKGLEAALAERGFKFDSRFVQGLALREPTNNAEPQSTELPA